MARNRSLTDDAIGVGTRIPHLNAGTVGTTGESTE